MYLDGGTLVLSITAKENGLANNYEYYFGAYMHRIKVYLGTK